MFQYQTIHFLQGLSPPRCPLNACARTLAWRQQPRQVSVPIADYSSRLVDRWVDTWFEVKCNIVYIQYWYLGFIKIIQSFRRLMILPFSLVATNPTRLCRLQSTMSARHVLVTICTTILGRLWQEGTNCWLTLSPMESKLQHALINCWLLGGLVAIPNPKF